MFRSPPNLRSGSKGQPVALSTADKPKAQRSLSAPSVDSSPQSTSTMPADNQPKTTGGVDALVIESCVKKYLSGGDVFDTLIIKLKEVVSSAVETAVKSALTAVNEQLAALHDEVSSLTGKVKELDEKLADRTDELEQYQRRNNLRIFGVDESDGENTDNILVALCKDKLGVELPVSAVCRSHRVGRQSAAGADGKKLPRPIIVRFISYRDRRLVFGAKKRLKGSGVTIREDLTPRRLEVFRAAVSQHGPRSTWTHDGKVFWVDGSGTRGAATRLADVSSATAQRTR